MDKVLRHNDLDNAHRAQIEKFTSTVRSCVNFVKRHDINSIALHGQEASATVEEAKNDMEKLRECLRDVGVDCIYNEDKKGRFYKLLPKRSYVTRYENKKTIPGSRELQHYRGSFSSKKCFRDVLESFG